MDINNIYFSTLNSKTITIKKKRKKEKNITNTTSMIIINNNNNVKDMKQGRKKCNNLNESFVLLIGGRGRGLYIRQSQLS